MQYTEESIFISHATLMQTSLYKIQVIVHLNENFLSLQSEVKSVMDLLIFACPVRLSVCLSEVNDA